MAKNLQAGDPAPEVALAADDGAEFRLSSRRGQTVVLYFYPKSDTPGCTTEACGFRDAFSDLAAKGAVVVGISPDSVVAQSKFKDKYGLGFVLLSDPAHSAAEAYGVWKEKSMYGKRYMGVERTTFVIGSDGRIARIYTKVKPAGHAAEVLGSL